MNNAKVQTEETVDSACEVLGVTTGDAWAEVKATYRRLAHEFHPDKHEEGTESAEKTARFRQVQEAFEFLQDHKWRFGFSETVSGSNGHDVPHHRSYDNTTENVPDPEFIRIDESFTAYIKYETTWFGQLVARLEIDIDDVAKLKWYPVPTHTDRIREVHVVRNGVPVMTYVTYSFLREVSEFRTAFFKWQVSERLKEEAARLQPRIEKFEESLDEMYRLQRPTVHLNHLIHEARRLYSRLNTSYKPSTPAEVERMFGKVDVEIERIRQGGPGVIIDDLLQGVFYHLDTKANQAVIDEVRSWHIRTDGFIDLINEPVLRAFYERRITSEKVGDLAITDLRLKLEDFVPKDIAEELDQSDWVAPATIELDASKGFSTYPLKYDYFERDGQKVPVATVILPLRVYEHNAPEYGKASGFPVLPFGIELRVEILFENQIIFSGTPGDELEKKITKFKRGRNRGKAVQGAGDELGLGRWRPLDSTPLPPWFKGARPRW